MHFLSFKNLLYFQAKGLATEYTTKRDTYSYIRKLLCLPFLPAEHIEVVFDSLADIAPLRFIGLLEYMRSTWFRSSVWPVECWSIFEMSIRTNNDVEGNLFSILIYSCTRLYALLWNTCNKRCF